MEHGTSEEVEVDAYLSGSVIQALTQKSENQIDDLHSTLNSANVEIQAGSDDFKVQCHNINKGPDGVLRLSVLDNGEVITSLQNHIDSYAVPEIINSGYEGVFEDNSETILNIASETIQGAQFLENVDTKDALISTLQETSLQDACDVLPLLTNKSSIEAKLTNNCKSEDILKDLEFNFSSNQNHSEQSVQTASSTRVPSAQFFTSDFDALWNEDDLPEPYLIELNSNNHYKKGSEHIDVANFNFWSKQEECDINLYSENLSAVMDNRDETADNQELIKLVEKCRNSELGSSSGYETDGSLNYINQQCAEDECKDKSSCASVCLDTIKHLRKAEENSTCVSVCLNTIKQLRKVLEQRCCMSGKTII